MFVFGRKVTFVLVVVGNVAADRPSAPKTVMNAPMPGIFDRLSIDFLAFTLLLHHIFATDFSLCHAYLGTKAIDSTQYGCITLPCPDRWALFTTLA